MVERILLWMVYFSWLYWVYACFLVRDHFFGHGATYEENSRNGAHGENGGRLPPVSILKPACGYDHEMYENFASFCRQDYGRYEIIFGVESMDDPAVECVQRLMRDFPDVDIRLVQGEIFGANKKVCLLHSMVAWAKFDILVISDSDIRVSSDYLRNVVTPVTDPRVGFVSCPYLGDKALTLAGKFEALHMGALFLPSALVGWRLGVSFALGATVVVRRKDLESIGGFTAIADYLADDFQIGCRLASLGLRPFLSRYIVRSILGPVKFSDQWFREVRWARCQRVSRPAEYPGVLLTLSTPLAFLLWAWSFFVADLPSETGLAQGIFFYSLILRYVTGWFMSEWLGDKETKKSLILLPFREMLSALVWLYGLFGRRIVWRGREYVLEQEGRMRTL